MGICKCQGELFQLLGQGAYLGRGRGNSFLNDLCDADSLVHVVDASGRSDAEGVDHGSSQVGSWVSLWGEDSWKGKVFTICLPNKKLMPNGKWSKASQNEAFWVCFFVFLFVFLFVCLFVCLFFPPIAGGRGKASSFLFQASKHLRHLEAKKSDHLNRPFNPTSRTCIRPVSKEDFSLEKTWRDQPNQPRRVVKLQILWKKLDGCVVRSTCGSSVTRCSQCRVPGEVLYQKSRHRSVQKLEIACEGVKVHDSLLKYCIDSAECSPHARTKKLEQSFYWAFYHLHKRLSICCNFCWNISLGNVRAKWDTVRRKAKLARQSVALQPLAAERLFALFTGWKDGKYLAITTWDVWNHVNNGIFTISTATGFLPSTASKVLLLTFIRVLFYVFFCDGFLCGNFCGIYSIFCVWKDCFRLDSWGFLYNLPSNLLLDIWISFLGVCGSHFIQSEIIDRLSDTRTMHMYMLCMCTISGWIIILNSRNKATFGRIPSYIRPFWVRSHNDIMMRFCRWASLGPSCIRPWVFSQDTPNKTHGIPQAGWATPMKFTKHPRFQHVKRVLHVGVLLWKQNLWTFPWHLVSFGRPNRQVTMPPSNWLRRFMKPRGILWQPCRRRMGALKVFSNIPWNPFRIQVVFKETS